MLRGLSTISLFADDLPAAARWYTDLLGTQPYFVRPLEGPPAYVEFRIGDYQHELGIIDRRFAPHAASAEPGGVVAFWHVDDIETTWARLLSLGASPHEEPVNREAGFITASVTDPFGNILGIMHSPHYLDVLGMRGTGTCDTLS
ncbi:VOC family protein [Saccharomonospora sp. NPDC006951]